MRTAILLSFVLLAAACGRKQDVYIVTAGTPAPAVEAAPIN